MSTRGFILDMDGVIYREDHLIEGAKELIEAFQETGTPFLFLTNNSAPTPEDLVVKMGHLGIEGLGPRHFYTSAMNTAEFLCSSHPNCTAYSVGEGGLLSAFKEAKIANDAIKPSYVVIGEGTPTMEKLNKAHSLIENGALLIATNPDNWCPVSSTATRPGAGATVAYLEASTGQRAYFLGKPNPYMFARAATKLGSNIPLGNIVMIGDTLETDIRGAIEVGMQSYLVLTGSTSLQDLPNHVYQPTRIMESVAELVEEIHSGIPSSRIQGITLASRLPETNHRNRHQTDEMRATKPRPAMTR